MKRGIDISYYQGDIDFEQVKNAGIDFVIIREGYRNTTDAKFFEYVEQAKSAGLQILGVYHFAYGLNEEETREEARFCVENVKKAGLDSDIVIFYDFEYDTVKKAFQKGVILTSVECRKHTEAFCVEIDRLGFTPGIYSNLDYYKNWYTKDFLSNYPIIWLADYTAEPDFPCMVQQYSSKGSIPGINGNVDLNYFFDEEFKIGEKPSRSRSAVVELAKSWIGKNEADGTHKEIIDIYNSFDGSLPQGVKMTYDMAWCACTWSALAIALGYTDIMPIEISCGRLIDRAKEMGCWVEDDSYVPSPGDAILYDWGDNGVGDNIGWPDHVGTVTSIDGNSITVVEGNKNDAVGTRNILVNSRYIRGFIIPAYDKEEVIEPPKELKDIVTIAFEVIQGIWGSGSDRKESLTFAGYDYTKVQKMVNHLLKSENLDFGLALKALKIGRKVARCSWDDVGFYLDYIGDIRLRSDFSESAGIVWSPLSEDCMAEDWKIL